MVRISGQVLGAWGIRMKAGTIGSIIGLQEQQICISSPLPTLESSVKYIHDTDLTVCAILSGHLGREMNLSS